MSKNSTPATAPQHTPFDAAFTHAQTTNFEADYNRTWGVKRRILMALLCSSSVELLSRISCADDAEVLITMAEAITDYHNHLNTGLELTTAALARLQSLAIAVDQAGLK